MTFSRLNLHQQTIKVSASSQYPGKNKNDIKIVPREIVSIQLVCQDTLALCGVLLLNSLWRRTIFSSTLWHYTLSETSTFTNIHTPPEHRSRVEQQSLKVKIFTAELRLGAAARGRRRKANNPIKEIKKVVRIVKTEHNQCETTDKSMQFCRKDDPSLGLGNSEY